MKKTEVENPVAGKKKLSKSIIWWSQRHHQRRRRTLSSMMKTLQWWYNNGLWWSAWRTTSESSSARCCLRHWWRGGIHVCRRVNSSRWCNKCNIVCCFLSLMSFSSILPSSLTQRVESQSEHPHPRHTPTCHILKLVNTNTTCRTSLSAAPSTLLKRPLFSQVQHLAAMLPSTTTRTHF